MQSSIAVVGRVLIMLACVVAIPAFALSGTSWSDMLKKLQDFRWPAVLNLARASTTSPSNVAPRLVPAATSRSPSNRPAAPAETAPPHLLAPAPATLPLSLPPPGSSGSSHVVPVGFQAPLAPLGVMPAARLGADNAAPTPSPALQTDPFRSIQERLRKLGATYYLLESWGSEQQLYRFYCKMAVGGNPDYTHYFEATHADPLQAMQQVLLQVEGWRGGAIGGAATN